MKTMVNEKFNNFEFKNSLFILIFWKEIQCDINNFIKFI